MNKPAFLLTLGLIGATFTSAQAQGTIQFSNNAGTRLSIGGVRPQNTSTGGPGAGAFTVGVFAGATADTISDQPAGPLGGNTVTGGLITAPSPNAYQIAGFAPGSTVFLQFRGWESRFGSDWQAAKAAMRYGETPVLPFVLGPEAGPGTVVWASTGGSQFTGMCIACIPEPSAVVLLGVGFVGLLLLRRCGTRTSNRTESQS